MRLWKSGGSEPVAGAYLYAPHVAFAGLSGDNTYAGTAEPGRAWLAGGA